MRVEQQLLQSPKVGLRIKRACSEICLGLDAQHRVQQLARPEKHVLFETFDIAFEKIGPRNDPLGQQFVERAHADTSFLFTTPLAELKSIGPLRVKRTRIGVRCVEMKASLLFGIPGSQAMIVPVGLVVISPSQLFDYFCDRVEAMYDQMITEKAPRSFTAKSYPCRP